MRRWAVLLGTIAAALTLAAGPAGAATGPFSDWAAIVVAGDWRAHSGGETEAFDNARRDVAASLTTLGFAKENIRQFSTRPDRYPDTDPARADLRPIYETLSALGQAAPGGCLVYYTSHGNPQGVVLDIEGQMMMVPPAVMADLVNQACPNRPSIVVISACFSGVFVPAMAEKQRMILTAARPDRSSFGCGEADKYPYFDDCFLQQAGKSPNFPALGEAVQACVAAKEAETGARPPSEPQLWIGPAIKPILPLYAFPAPPKATP